MPRDRRHRWDRDHRSVRRINRYADRGRRNGRNRRHRRARGKWNDGDSSPDRSSNRGRSRSRRVLRTRFRRRSHFRRRSWFRSGAWFSRRRSRRMRRRRLILSKMHILRRGCSVVGRAHGSSQINHRNRQRYYRDGNRFLETRFHDTHGNRSFPGENSFQSLFRLARLGHGNTLPPHSSRRGL